MEGNPLERERLASLEAQVRTMTELLTRVDSKLDALQTVFVPRTELIEMFRQRDERLSRLETEADNNKNRLPQWVSVGIATVALLAGIFIPFLKG